MNWSRSHPRAVRGEAVHEPQKEKKEKEIMRQQVYEEVIQQIGLEGTNGFKTANGFKTETNRIDPENLLVPEIKNFVDTTEIQELKNRIKMWMKLGHPVHLIGPTGCGKTTLAIQAAKEMNKHVVWINGDEEMSTTDLTGGYSEVETSSLRDNYVHNVLKVKDVYKAGWIDNPLTIACKYGYALVYNEFSRSLPQANNVLLSVFEEKILELPTKSGQDRYIKVHPNFVSIFTSNSIEYAGVHKPQDALLDRMIGIYMDYYDFDTELKIVKANSKIPAKEAERVVKIIRLLRKRLEGGERPGTRACILLAQGLEASGSFKKADYKQICMDVLASKTNGQLDFSQKIEVLDQVLEEVDQ